MKWECVEKENRKPFECLAALPMALPVREAAFEKAFLLILRVSQRAASQCHHFVPIFLLMTKSDTLGQSLLLFVARCFII